MNKQILVSAFLVIASFSTNTTIASLKQNKPTERACIATYGVSSICICAVHKQQYSSYKKNGDEVAGQAKDWKPVAQGSDSVRKYDLVSK